MDIDLSAIQWLYVAIIAPVLGWLGGWFQSWNRQRRKAKTIVSHLSGLPPEAKSVLIDFNFQGAHTLRGNPGDPATRLLVKQGILSVGPGGGTYDAVDSYLTVRLDIWEAVDDWIKTDITVIPLLEEFLEKRKHNDPPNPSR